jgi:hypothetical protein
MRLQIIDFTLDAADQFQCGLICARNSLDQRKEKIEKNEKF